MKIGPEMEVTGDLWLQEHWSTWPKAEALPDNLTMPKAVYDLGRMVHWFVPFQRATPGKKEPPT
jgi:hypothetical protein